MAAANDLTPVTGGNQAWVDIPWEAITYVMGAPGDRFFNTNRSILLVKNENGSMTSIDVTVNSVADDDGRLAPDSAQTVTVADGETKIIGPLPNIGWVQTSGDDDGYINITYSADVSDVYVAVVNLGSGI